MENERFDRIARLVSGAMSRRSALNGLAASGLGAALGLSRLGLGTSSVDVEAKKRKRKKRIICHCPTNDPSSCSTIRIRKKSSKKHLKHHCDYKGPCQPGKVGECTPPFPPFSGCAQDDDCGGATPFCQNRVCVQCRNDNGCPSGQVCQDGTCVTGCKKDADCGAGEFCQDGACVVGCKKDSDCGGDTPFCSNTVCVACRTTDDCCAPQICNSNNQCVIACGSGECNPNTQKCCTPNQGAPVCISFDQCCSKLSGQTEQLDVCLPNTNAENEANNRPYVELVDSTAGAMVLNFVNPTNVLSFFEYRVDGQMLTCGEEHVVILGDWEYDGICLGGACPPGPVEATFDGTAFPKANQKVEVRLALGAENDYFFDSGNGSGWVTFNAGDPV